jgi:hypothetical protein
VQQEELRRRAQLAKAAADGALARWKQGEADFNHFDSLRSDMARTYATAAELKAMLARSAEFSSTRAVNAPRGDVA